MAKKDPQSEPTPSRVPGDTGPLPRVQLDEFRKAQRDPKVKQALHEARDENARLRHQGLIHD